MLLAQFNLGNRIEYLFHVCLHTLHHYEQIFTAWKILRGYYVQNFDGEIISTHLAKVSHDLNLSHYLFAIINIVENVF